MRKHTLVSISLSLDTGPVFSHKQCQCHQSNKVSGLISINRQWGPSCCLLKPINPKWLKWNCIKKQECQSLCFNLIRQHPRICYNTVMDEWRRMFAWDLNHVNPLLAEVIRNTRSWRRSSLSAEMNVAAVCLKIYKQCLNEAKYFLLILNYCTMGKILNSKTISYHDPSIYLQKA